MKSIPIITKYFPIFFIISAIFLIPGIFSIYKYGLRLGLDFTGGTILELRVSQEKREALSQSDLTKTLSEIETPLSIQFNDQIMVLKFPPIDLEKKQKIVGKIKEIDKDVAETRYETIGPVLAKELVQKTFFALVLSIFLITIYLGIRFASFHYGIVAALATLHDILIVLGGFSLLGHFLGVEIDVLFVTAVLTILSFSVHDTIVVFDRIREKQSKAKDANFEDLVDQAAVETLNRSLRNSLAIIFMLLTVFLMTTGSLQWFVFALLLGTITGTYSSTCVAMPLLIVWRRVGAKIFRKQII